MNIRILAATLLVAIAPLVSAAKSASEPDRYQRQYQYAQMMMRLNGIGGGLSAAELATMKVSRPQSLAGAAQARSLRDHAIDAFAAAAEQSLAKRRAKRGLSQQWSIHEAYPSHWSVSSNPEVAAQCAHAIEVPLDQPLRIDMNRNGIAWLRVVAPGKGFWAFDTLVSEFDTKLSVYRDCRDIGGTPQQVSDDAVGLGSIVGLQAKNAGQTWLLKLERVGGVGSLAIAKGATAGSISGRVTRAIDGMPVASASVRAMSGIAYVNAESDANGDYSLPILETADYEIRVDPPFSDASLDVVAEYYPSATCPPNYQVSPSLYCIGTIEPVHGDPMQDVTGIDFQLDAAAEIIGFVVDDRTGLAVSNGVVRLFANEDSGDLHSAQVVNADAAGRFRFNGLPARAWRAEFRAAEYRAERWHDLPCAGVNTPFPCDLGSGQVIETSSAAVTHLAVGLQPRASITVNVTRNGAVPSYSYAKIYGESGNYVGDATANDGSVTFESLNPGRYRIVAGALDAFERVYGGAESELPASPLDPVLLTGQVVDFPGATSEISVDVRPLPMLHGHVEASDGTPISGLVWLISATGQPNQTVISDIGDYQFQVPVAGSYRLYFDALGYVNEIHPDTPCESPDPVANCFSGVTLDFGLQSPPSIQVSAQLARAHHVAGSIKQQNGAAAIGTVRIDRLGLAGNTLASYIVSAQDGRYVVREPTLGTYLWGTRPFFSRSQLFDRVNCAPSNAPIPYGECNAELATPVTLTAGENRDDIDFAVVPTQYRMVRVIDETTGSPLAGITIDQWSLAGQWMYGPATDSEGWALIRPNSIDGTAENFYAVQVSTDSLGRYIDEVYDHHACPAGTSVYRAGCSLAGAAAVLVSDDLNQVFPPIEIRLRSAIPLFSSGFE